MTSEHKEQREIELTCYKTTVDLIRAKHSIAFQGDQVHALLLYVTRLLAANDELEKELETERLLVKGLEGNLKACEDELDRMDTLHMRAEKRVKELEALQIIPGAFECLKCGFLLQKSVLYVKSGSIGPEISNTVERCPNDNETMIHLTEKRCHELTVKNCEGQIKRAVKAEDRVKELESDKITLANLLENANASAAELRKDKERLDWVFKFIHDHGTYGLSDLPWTVYEESGEDSDIRFDRAAIDSAAKEKL